MFEIQKKIADLICYGDTVLSPQKWLAEEAANLAIRIRQMDEIPSQAILPLARLVAYGECDSRKLALSIDIDEPKLDEYLDALIEFKFAEETLNGYRATPSGVQAIDAIGVAMVERELFVLKGRLQHLEMLRKGLHGS